MKALKTLKSITRIIALAPVLALVISFMMGFEARAAFTELHEAIRDRDESAALRLIERGRYINEKEERFGMTPLHDAARYGNPQIVQALINSGANLDAKANSGWTPLHEATFYIHPQIVQILANAGANLDAQENKGWTPLHYVAKWTESRRETERLIRIHMEILHTLINAGADVNVKGTNDFTPLHFAAVYGRTEIALALVAAGADVNAKDAGGYTPLDIAASDTEDAIRAAIEK